MCLVQPFDLPEPIICDFFLFFDKVHLADDSLSSFLHDTSLVARGQTGKGANLSLFGGAFKACAAGVQTG
jgi:hypothetical protein